MKKIIAAALVMVMLLSVTASFAAGYPSGDVGGAFSAQIEKAFDKGGVRNKNPFPNLSWQKGAVLGDALPDLCDICGEILDDCVCKDHAVLANCKECGLIFCDCDKDEPDDPCGVCNEEPCICDDPDDPCNVCQNEPCTCDDPGDPCDVCGDEPCTCNEPGGKDNPIILGGNGPGAINNVNDLIKRLGDLGISGSVWIGKQEFFYDPNDTNDNPSSKSIAGLFYGENYYVVYQLSHANGTTPEKHYNNATTIYSLQDGLLEWKPQTPGSLTNGEWVLKV